MMDFSRISSVLNVDQMRNAKAAFIGAGGGANLCRNMVRCGLGYVKLVDFDRVEAVNICRQEYTHDDIGKLKVEALAQDLKAINPDVEVEYFPHNFCSFTDEEIVSLFGDMDVFAFCVDNLPANARGNEVALKLGKPAVWSGVYTKGQVGEIVFWHPGLDSCYRCLCSARYKAHEQGKIQNRSADSPDILSVQYIDSITGMIVLGQLTRGSDNFYGRLIDQLGDRNFLQVKVSPEWTWNGRDIFREQLGIPAENEAYYSFVTIARRDPDRGIPPCPDCAKYRWDAVIGIGDVALPNEDCSQ